jgi:hypothetical protein
MNTKVSVTGETSSASAQTPFSADWPALCPSHGCDSGAKAEAAVEASAQRRARERRTPTPTESGS